MACPKTWLNRTRGFPLCYFFSLLGLYSLETPSGSTIARHTMQQPRRQKATLHHGTPRWSLLASEIPALNYIPQLAVGGDMSNSPTFLLIALLVSFCFDAPFLNKQCIALDYYRILYSFIYIYICSFMTFNSRTVWYGQYVRGLSVPHNMA